MGEMGGVGALKPITLSCEIFLKQAFSDKLTKRQKNSTAFVFVECIYVKTSYRLITSNQQ